MRKSVSIAFVLLVIQLIVLMPVQTARALTISDVQIDTGAKDTTVNWRTDYPAEGRLDWGIDQNYDKYLSSTQKKTEHDIRAWPLEPFKQYFYKVTVKNGSSDSASVEGTFMTEHTPAPLKVENLRSVLTTLDSITIAWDRAEDDNFLTHNIYRNGVLLTTTTTTSYTDSELSPGMTYFYEISGADVDGNEGPKSDALYAITASPDIDAPVISGLTIDGTDPVIIKWLTDEVSDSKVEYGTTVALGNDESSITGTVNHEIQIAGLIAGTKYYYKVISCDAALNCAESTISEFIVGSSSAASDNFIDIEELPQVTHLNNIDIKGETNPFSLVQIFVNNRLRGTIREAPENGKFKFSNVYLDTGTLTNTLRFYSKDIYGNEAMVEKNIVVDVSAPDLYLDAIESITTENLLTLTGTVNEPATINIYIEDFEDADMSAPGAVFNMQANYQLSDDQILLTWDPVSDQDLSNYAVYRDGRLIGTTQETEFRDGHLDADEEYDYHVTALDVFCTEGAASDTASITTPVDRLNTSSFVDLPEGACLSSPQYTFEANGAILQEISLNSGTNLIKVEAIDIAGNVRSEFFIVVSDNEPPELMDNNLNLLSPSYTCEEKIRGRVSEDSLVYVYVNDDSDPRASGRTDDDGNFKIDVEFDRKAEFEFESDDSSHATTSQTGRAWENAVRLVIKDGAGNTYEYTDTIICAICGEGSDWAIETGYPQPNELVPRHFMEGFASISFGLNMSWNGFEKNASGRMSVSIEPMEISSTEKELYDADWVKDISYSPSPINPAIGYVQIKLNKQNPEVEGKDNPTVYDREDVIASNHKGECLIPKTGCVKLPLVIKVDYDVENYQGKVESRTQKQCLDMEVMIQPRIPPDMIPDGLLNASIQVIDSLLDVINKTLAFIEPITKYAVISCLVLMGVWFVKKVFDWTSCMGVKEDECACSDPETCESDECVSCYNSKLTTAKLEKAMHYICDRVMCPAAPSFDYYVSQNYDPRVPSHCNNYGSVIKGAIVNGIRTVDYNSDTAVYDQEQKQECANRYIHPMYDLEGGINNNECCEEEYMDRWDSSILLMNEFKESKCISQKNQGLEGSEGYKEDCGDFRSIFNAVADFSLCKGGAGNGRIAMNVEGQQYEVDINEKVAYFAENVEESNLDEDGLKTDKKERVNRIGTLMDVTLCEDRAWEGTKVTHPKTGKKIEIPTSVAARVCSGYNAGENKYVASPTNGLMRAVQAVCLAAINSYLKMYKKMLTLIKNCFMTIMLTGDGSSGMCQAIITQYVCDIIYYAISCVKEYTDSGAGSDGHRGISGFFKHVRSSMGEVQSGVTDRYGDSNMYQVMFVKRKLIHSVCLAAFTGNWNIDWEGLIDEAAETPVAPIIVVAPANRRFMGYNPVDGMSDHVYHMGLLIIGGADTQYKVELVCSNTNTCTEFNNSECDCLRRGREETYVVTGDFGTGQIDSSDVVNEENYIQINQGERAKIRYDKVRVTYTWDDGKNKILGDPVEADITKIGDEPPVECRFDIFAASYLCSYYAGETGYARFVEWPRQNPDYNPAGPWKEDGKVSLIMNSEIRLPQDSTEGIAKVLRIRLKNHNGREVFQRNYDITTTTWDQTRFIPETDFRLTEDIFLLKGDVKGSCSEKSEKLNNLPKLGGISIVTFTSEEYIVQYNTTISKYEYCVAVVRNTGSQNVYSCDATGLVNDKWGPSANDKTHTFYHGKNQILIDSSNKPSQTQAIIIGCQGGTAKGGECDDKVRSWPITVSLHSKNSDGAVNQIADTYNNVQQIWDGTLSVQCKQGANSGTSIPICGSLSQTNKECNCQLEGSTTACYAGQYCCTNGCQNSACSS